MRVRLISTMASADFVASAGTVVDLPDSKARELVELGYAAPASAPQGRRSPERQQRQAPETREAPVLPSSPPAAPAGGKLV